jgi:hypothetical protein
MESKDSVTNTQLSSVASSEMVGDTVKVHDTPATHPIQIGTRGTSERDFYSKELVVRGTDTVTIKVNIDREVRMYRNIIANRGLQKVNTSTNDDE